jgi:hypothetical protein
MCCTLMRPLSPGMVGTTPVGHCVAAQPLGKGQDNQIVLVETITRKAPRVT